MPRLLRTFPGLLFAVIVGISCISGNEAIEISSNTVSPSVNGPTVSLIDSVLLSDPDTVPLGARLVFARSASGVLFVADAETGIVVRYEPDGSTPKVLGWRGDGPGEFRGPGTIGLVAHDSLLTVVDVRRKYLTVLDAKTGTYLRGFNVPFTIAGHSWTVREDTVFFTAFPSSNLLVRWNWREDSVVTSIPVPAWVRDAGNIAASYGWPEAIVQDSLVVALIPTEPGLDLFHANGTFLGQVRVPAARRLGNPPNLVALQEAQIANDGAFKILASTPVAIGSLSNGNIAILMLDLDLSEGNGGRPLFNVLGYYLSIVSADFQRVCVDALIPFQSDGVSIPTFQNDTLSMLARQVQDDDAVRTVVYAFAISEDGCEWVPTGGPLQVP